MSVKPGFHNNICNRASLVPRYSGLNHFSLVSSIEFTDGTKFEDLSKVKHCSLRATSISVTTYNAPLYR